MYMIDDMDNMDYRLECIEKHLDGMVTLNGIDDELGEYYDELGFIKKIVKGIKKTATLPLKLSPTARIVKGKRDVAAKISRLENKLAKATKQKKQDKIRAKLEKLRGGQVAAPVEIMLPVQPTRPAPVAPAIKLPSFVPPPLASPSAATSFTPAVAREEPVLVTDVENDGPTPEPALFVPALLIGGGALLFLLTRKR